MTDSNADSYFKTMQDITKDFRTNTAFLRILHDEEIRTRPTTPYEKSTLKTLDYILRGEVPSTKSRRSEVKYRLIWLISVNESTENSDLQEHLEALLRAVNEEEKPSVVEVPETAPEAASEASEETAPAWPRVERWENEGGATLAGHVYDSLSTDVDTPAEDFSESLSSHDSHATALKAFQEAKDQASNSVSQTLHSHVREVVRVVEGRIQSLSSSQEEEAVGISTEARVQEVLANGKVLVAEKISSSYLWTKAGLVKLSRATRSGTQAFLSELKND